jgi:hypothetical protein
MKEENNQTNFYQLDNILKVLVIIANHLRNIFIAVILLIILLGYSLIK